MTVDVFVEQLSSITLNGVFNPYRDVCSRCDDADSPVIRKRNVSLFLQTMIAQGARSLWLGRDLGYLGGRRTGIPLTDEFHLPILSSSLGIEGIEKATIDLIPKKERTAAAVWKIIENLEERVVLWNVFPFHPFEIGDPMSNRRHTRQEFESCRDILNELISWLQPETIVALGADAQVTLQRLGVDCTKVRHPSHGGQLKFTRQIQQLYSHLTDSSDGGYTSLLPLPT